MANHPRPELTPEDNALPVANQIEKLKSFQLSMEGCIGCLKQGELLVETRMALEKLGRQ